MPKEDLDTRIAVAEVRLDEHERRMGDLNHARREEHERNRDYVTRDLHDKLESTFNERVNDINARLITIEGRSKGIGDSWGVLVSVIVAAGAVVAVLTYFFMKG